MVAMNSRQILTTYNIAGYVTDIFVFENDDEKKKTTLPFFADGFPGIMFLQSSNAATLYPGNKPLSNLFLYGQTVKPIEIMVDGPFRFIVFQLCPFALKVLFHVNPKVLNDGCYDLLSDEYPEARELMIKMLNTIEATTQMEYMAAFLSKLSDYIPDNKSDKVHEAIKEIIQQKGKVTVKSLIDKLHITERTLQRQFEEFIGISPKQFAKIIQFNYSKDQITGDDFSKLSDVVYENGYADQSHFIRNFKNYTGKKPSQFKITSR